MGRAQRQKGKRGERLAAKAVTAALGLKSKRGCQFKGGPDSADIEVEMAGVHWEVKFVEREAVRAWMKQAVAESGGQIPVVVHKKSREGWLLTLPLERVYEFCERFREALDTPVQTVGGDTFPGAIPPPVLPSPAGQAAGPARLLPVGRGRGAGADSDSGKLPPGCDS